jgi:hypothetical protein
MIKWVADFRRNSSAVSGLAQSAVDCPKQGVNLSDLAPARVPERVEACACSKEQDGCWRVTAA